MTMRVLVDSENYFSNNDNIGDRAIYQGIVGRLRRIWPNCRIQWITRNAGLIKAICPDVSAWELTADREHGGRSLAEDPPT